MTSTLRKEKNPAPGESSGQRMLSRAVFPGSFDPFTNGHTDIITRALGIFDEIVVAVLSNPSKQCLFSLEERVAIIEHTFAAAQGKVSVRSFSGLLVEFVAGTGTKIVLRGLRAVSDYDYEAQMALMNRHLSPGIETFFLMSREDCSYISSSVVKQIAKFGGSVKDLVPLATHEALEKKFQDNAPLKPTIFSSTP